MDELLQAIGLVVVVMWLLGALNIIDFHICARPVGNCHIKKDPT